MWELASAHPEGCAPQAPLVRGQKPGDTACTPLP
jgi:hypothetical protein